MNLKLTQVVKLQTLFMGSDIQGYSRLWHSILTGTKTADNIIPRRCESWSPSAHFYQRIGQRPNKSSIIFVLDDIQEVSVTNWWRRPWFVISGSSRQPFLLDSVRVLNIFSVASLTSYNLAYDKGVFKYNALLRMEFHSFSNWDGVSGINNIISVVEKSREIGVTGLRTMIYCDRRMYFVQAYDQQFISWGLTLRLDGKKLMTLPTKFSWGVGLSKYLCNSPMHSHLKVTMWLFACLSAMDMSTLDTFDCHVSLIAYIKFH